MPSKNLLRLSNLDNTVVTSHVAWNTDQSMHNLADELLEVLESCSKNQPKNIVSLKKTYINIL